MKNEVAVCVKLLSQGNRILMCGERSCLTTNMYMYTPYEGLNLTNQKNRKLEVFSWKLEENHSVIDCYFHRYQRK